jgi:Family of unknown function (DUF5681)
MSEPPNDGRFKPGQSGNPIGRPLNRHKIAGRFLADLQAEWEISGKAALAKMAKDEPSKLVQIVASLLPKESSVDIKLAVEQRFNQMTYNELLQLKEVYDAALPLEDKTNDD